MPSVHAAARYIVGKLHVSASNRDVIRACHRALAKPYRMRAKRNDRKRKHRHILYRHALAVHRDNYGLYAQVTRGLI